MARKEDAFQRFHLLLVKEVWPGPLLHVSTCTHGAKLTSVFIQAEPRYIVEHT